MDNQQQLQALLENLLGSRNVYYNPPESKRMEYDAIRYYKSGINTIHANNGKYVKRNRYELIVIARLPDPEVVELILEFPYSSLGTPYVADNLYHYPITLYY